MAPTTVPMLVSSANLFALHNSICQTTTTTATATNPNRLEIAFSRFSNVRCVRVWLYKWMLLTTPTDTQNGCPVPCLFFFGHVETKMILRLKCCRVSKVPTHHENVFM